MEQLYSCADIAKRYGVKLRTAQTWVSKGILKGYKIGKSYRVKDSDLKAFEESNAINKIVD